MKIENMQIDDYKVFKDFNISFLYSDNKPLDLIVLAGINGSGKTTILEFIIDKLYENIKQGEIFLNADDYIFNDIVLGSHKIYSITAVLRHRYSGTPYYNVIESFKKRIIYIKAQEQKTDEIKKEIIKYLDTLIFEKELSAKEAYKKLREELDFIFENLDMQAKFSGLDRDKNIFFENSLGGKISIDSLSTGEKELLSKVFFLYISDIKDSIILIDEPETSLHPSWQNRVVKIYKNFAKKNNNQIIIATHSPQIIASTPNESLRVLVKEGDNIKAYSPDAYGMQVNKALTDIMGVNELRDIEVQNQYDKVKNMILANEYKRENFQDELSKLGKMMENDSLDFGLLKLELLKRQKNNKQSIKTYRPAFCVK